MSTLGRVYKGFFSRAFQAYCVKERVCSRDMDIRLFFSDTSAPSTSASRLSSRSSEDELDNVNTECRPPSPKKHCTSRHVSTQKSAKYHSVRSSYRIYSKKWEKDFCWLEYDEDCEGAFCKLCRTSGKTLQ